MVLYSCDICNFSTNKTTNYNRHLQTKKHLKNVKDHSLYNISLNGEKGDINNLYDHGNISPYSSFVTVSGNKTHNVSKKYPQVSKKVKKRDIVANIVIKFLVTKIITIDT